MVDPETYKKAAIFPIAGLFIGIATLIATFSIFDAYDRDYGGIDFPYISDTGRKYPEKYVFIIGLTILALLNFVIHYYVYKFLCGVVNTKRRRRAALAATIMIYISSINLGLLAGFDNGEYETVHTTNAVMFFVLVMIALTIYLTVYWSSAFQKNYYEPKELRPSLIVKGVSLLLGWIFFIIFVPIGYSVATYHYDEKYDNYDYRSDRSFNELRTISEFLMVISMLVFIGSWSMDFRRASHITESVA